MGASSGQGVGKEGGASSIHFLSCPAHFPLGLHRPSHFESFLGKKSKQEIVMLISKVGYKLLNRRIIQKRKKNIFRSQTLNSLALNFKNFISIIEIKIPGLACEQGQGALHRGRGGKRTRGTFFNHPPLPSREVACRHYFPGNYKKNHIRHIEITVHVSYHKVTSASWPKLAPIPHGYSSMISYWRPSLMDTVPWFLIDVWRTRPEGGEVGGREVSTKFYTWRLYPEVQTLTLLYPIFSRKRYLFRVPSVDKWYSFHKPSLQLCIL